MFCPESAGETGKTPGLETHFQRSLRARPEFLTLEGLRPADEAESLYCVCGAEGLCLSLFGQPLGLSRSGGRLAGKRWCWLLLRRAFPCPRDGTRCPAMGKLQGPPCLGPTCPQCCRQDVPPSPWSLPFPKSTHARPPPWMSAK